jgi:hypothetical protein
VLESLAYSVMSRIEDVLGADAAATNLTASEAARRQMEMKRRGSWKLRRSWRSSTRRRHP